MSGPRVTSGTDSKQDYQSPADFMAAISRRFGPPQFDLAAHRGNKQHARYFAPTTLVKKIDRTKQPAMDIAAIVASFVAQGAEPEQARRVVENAATWTSQKFDICVPNSDPDAFGFDAFAYQWAKLSSDFETATHGPGLLYLNCEFNDVPPWAKRSAQEARLGANITLLTPAVTGANWFRDIIIGVADVYFCNGRLMFDGKNVFPKDCMVSHFHPNATGALHVWDWRDDVLVRSWRLA